MKEKERGKYRKRGRYLGDVRERDGEERRERGTDTGRNKCSWRREMWKYRKRKRVRIREREKREGIER
jgi:hypothetical protein